jgi:hypothetical protein
MLERLRNQNKPQAEPAPAAKEEPKPAEKPVATPEEDDLMEGGATGNSLLPDHDKKPDTEPKAAQPEKKDGAPPPDGKKEKVNPWHLVEEAKTKRAELEKQVADLQKLVPNAELRKQELAEVEGLRKRNQELEQHMRFVDFRESAEYKEKYEKPYQSQWKTSMKELDGVTVESDDGQMRPISPQDMLELVNLPLVKAKQLAVEKFGDFASDVIAHRAAIREKFEAREAALEGAKKDGDEYQKTAMKSAQDQYGKLSSELKGVYDKAVDFITKDRRHSDYLNERDGDDEGNALLKKGYELVDKAFSQNPMTEGLTMEQRSSIIKQHAAVRHKAAAYSRLIRDIKAERAAHEETKRKLAEFEATVPSRGASIDPAKPAVNGGSAMDRMKAKLRARATATV